MIYPQIADGLIRQRRRSCPSYCLGLPCGRGASVLGCLEVGDPAAPCGACPSRRRSLQALPLRSTAMRASPAPHVHRHASEPCPSRRRPLRAPPLTSTLPALPLTSRAMRALPLTSTHPAGPAPHVQGHAGPALHMDGHAGPASHIRGHALAPKRITVVFGFF